MDNAIAINKNTGKEQAVTAHQFRDLIKSNPSLKKQFHLVSPTSLTPLTFCKGGHSAGGHVIQDIRPHFKYAAGHGKTMHVFDHETRRSSFVQALDDGKKVIFSLNLDLSYRQLDFEKNNGGYPYQMGAWINKHYGNYISVPIHNTAEALDKILKIHRHDPSKPLKDRVFIRYRGGVLPYQEFYLGRREQDLKAVYDDLKSLKNGVEFKEEDSKEWRILGTPRLINFVPGAHVLKTPGVKSIKGNYPEGQRKYQNAPKYGHQLIFSGKGIEKTQEFTALWNKMAESMAGDNPKEKGIFVFATPTITAHQKGEEPKNAWKYVRWIINDINLQTSARITEPAPPPATDLAMPHPAA